MAIHTDAAALSHPTGLFTAVTASALTITRSSDSKGSALRGHSQADGEARVGLMMAFEELQEFNLACNATRLLGVPKPQMKLKAAQLQQLAQQANVPINTCLQALAEAERCQEGPGALGFPKALLHEPSRTAALACLISASQNIAPARAEALLRSGRQNPPSTENALLQLMRQRRNNLSFSASFIAIAAYFLYACHLQNCAEAKPDTQRADSAAFFRLTSILGFFYCGSYAMRFALEGLMGTSSIHQAKQARAIAELKSDLGTLTQIICQNTRPK